jgi:hypothetical protein
VCLTLSTVSDLVKVFDQHKQLTLSPQLVRFTRLGSATETASVTKPEGSVKASVASNSLYRVPIKPEMSLGSIKQAVSDLDQANKDLVGSEITPGPSGLAVVASKSSLTSTTASAEGTLVDISDNVTGSAVEAVPNGTSLDWTEDDAMSLLYTENGATDNLPHHLQLQDQVPFTPVFTAEEAAASAAMSAPREAGSPVGAGQVAPTGNFLATMEFSVTTPITPTTVKARLPQLQARRQLPFGGAAGTPKRKKPSSSTKKRAVSAGVSLAEDSSSSGEDPATSSGVASGKHISGRKGTRDTMAVEIDALKEQLKKVQMDLLNRQLETMEVIAAVKTDLMQLHNRVQHHQEAHINLEGVVGHTAARVTNTEASISDIHTRLSEVDRKQAEVQRALKAIKAMPTPNARTPGGQALAHTAAFFLGGIPQLRSLLELGQRADPMEVVSKVMRDICMYCAVDRIFLADTQAASRVKARAVVIYMRTPFHKREAMIKLKRFLAHWEVQEATVRDCFPTDVMERARNLASYGAHLRRTEDSVRRYQVANRNGEPILQVAGGNGRYVDQAIDEEALKALNAGQASNQAQREANWGKTGPRHAAKNKKHNKQASGRSSPMATNEETASSAIPADSVNAVPQGLQRKTTHLASANLSRKDRAVESAPAQETQRPAAPTPVPAGPLPRPLLHPQPQRPWFKSPGRSLFFCFFLYIFSRFYTYFIIKYSTRLSSRAGPNLAEW